MPTGLVMSSQTDAALLSGSISLGAQELAVCLIKTVITTMFRHTWAQLGPIVSNMSEGRSDIRLGYRGAW